MNENTRALKMHTCCPVRPGRIFIIIVVIEKEHGSLCSFNSLHSSLVMVLLLLQFFGAPRESAIIQIDLYTKKWIFLHFTSDYASNCLWVHWIVAVFSSGDNLEWSGVKNIENARDLELIFTRFPMSYCIILSCVLFSSCCWYRMCTLYCVPFDGSFSFMFFFGVGCHGTTSIGTKHEKMCVNWQYSCVCVYVFVMYCAAGKICGLRMKIVPDSAETKQEKQQQWQHPPNWLRMRLILFVLREFVASPSPWLAHPLRSYMHINADKRWKWQQE